ncbi:hypothetical protein KIN20_007658 [Parelaphostrongylus tenuis]|uniref:Uncharacterized protein n=1 Tax=Parelaphostrongylus tenuis TaxID=148309 RepID=A0AAD5QM60_PARTN|nr:hypothetical protein KIN20_007658 [Parelaphostrongylus tenuis]
MEHYRYDPPLSEHGRLSAEVAGYSIKLGGYEPTVTACAIAQAFAPTSIQICIEPSLADWVQLTPLGTSKQWLNPRQFSQFDRSVNVQYKPYLAELPASESPADYLKRLSRFFNSISGPNEEVTICFITWSSYKTR